MRGPRALLARAGTRQGVIGLVLALALLASACGGGGGTSEESEPAEQETVDEAQQTEPSEDEGGGSEGAASGEGLKVGYISLGEQVPFAVLVSNGIREEAEKAGVDLAFCDSRLDAATALSCAQDFQVQGVQGVLNFQVDQESSPEICAAYGDVPTIAIDIVQEPCQVAFMGANNREAGRMGGEALGQFFQEEFDCEYDAYVSLESTASGSANADRMGGYREGFEEYCPIVNERVLDGADRTDPALTLMTDLLTAVPGERLAVVAINEDGILGAIGAARTQGREGDLYYSGQGTDPSIWCEIKNNPNYIASVAYFPERYGQILIPAIISILNGEQVEEELYTEHEVITADNIDDTYEVTGC